MHWPRFGGTGAGELLKAGIDLGTYPRVLYLQPGSQTSSRSTPWAWTDDRVYVVI
jgi:hypothetical protein